MNDDDKICNIKVNFYNEQIELKINSDYNSFLKNVCRILKISEEQTNSITLRYVDEDGDNIIITNQDDYSICFEQVKKEIVKEIVLEINEKSKFDPIKCLGSALDYKDQIEKENNNFNDDNIGNNINNIKDFDNLIKNEESININIPNGNIVFNYRCSSCSTYPILSVMYYCDKCILYLCEYCHQNFVKSHYHQMEKITTKAQLDQIKKIENDELEEINKKKDDINNINHIKTYNPGSEKGPKFLNYILHPIDSYRKFKLNKEKKKMEMKEKSLDLNQNMKYIKISRLCRKKYNLEGISDEKLMNALIKANGNVDQAFIYLSE